jgi:hypothetical protein
MTVSPNLWFILLPPPIFFYFFFWVVVNRSEAGLECDRFGVREQYRTYSSRSTGLIRRLS